LYRIDVVSVRDEIGSESTQAVAKNAFLKARQIRININRRKIYRL